MFTSMKKPVAIVVSLLLPLNLTSCSSLPLDDYDQRSIGRGAKDALFAKDRSDAIEDWRLLDDPELLEYISSVGEKLRTQTHVSFLGITVIDTPVVQAMSGVGGGINITLGMLNFIESEAELACLLGHEIHHQIQATTQEDTSRTNDILKKVYEEYSPSQIHGLGIGKDLEDISYANWSKERETNADAQGSLLCARAGYDAFGLVHLQNRIAKDIAHSSLETIRNLKGSHDQLQDRSQHLEKWLLKKGYVKSHGKIGDREYRDVFYKKGIVLSQEQTRALTTLSSIKKEVDRSRLKRNSISAHRFVQITTAVSEIVKNENVTPQELYPLASSAVSGDRFMQERVINGRDRYGNAHDQIAFRVFEVLDALGRVAIGFTSIGAVIDFHDLVTGKDFFSGEDLTRTQRALSAIGLIIGQGQNLRRIEGFVNGTAAEVKGIFRSAKDATRIESKSVSSGRFVRDLPGIEEKFGNAFEGNIFKGPMKEGDIVYQAQRTGQQSPGRWVTPVKPVSAEHAEEMLNIRKHQNNAGQIKAYRFKEDVSGYAGKIEGGSGHQFKIPEDINPSEILEEITL